MTDKDNDEDRGGAEVAAGESVPGAVTPAAEDAPAATTAAGADALAATPAAREHEAAATATVADPDATEPVPPAETVAEVASAAPVAAGPTPLPDDEEPSLDGISPAAASAKIRSIVESLLFASDKPLTIKQIKDVLSERDGNVVRAALAALRAAESEERGLVLHEVAGGFQLRTHPDNAPWVSRLLQARPVRLTRPSLECLAIVAYRQPVTRADVEEVRGVDSGGVLKLLLDRNLIRILGKKEEPGRPLLYGTSKEFLTFFNLRDLRDLPTLRDFSELSEEHRLKVESLHGIAPEAPPPGDAPPPLAPGERPKLTLVPGGVDSPAAAEGAAPEETAAGDAPAAPDTAVEGAPAGGAAAAAEGAATDAADEPMDATAVDLAEAAAAAAATAAERVAARARPEAERPEHEDAAAREARLRREREHAEIDDGLVGELEAALKQADRVRREIDPPKPRAPRVPGAPPLAGAAADGAAPDGVEPGADGAGAAAPLDDEPPPPDDEPLPVC